LAGKTKKFITRSKEGVEAIRIVNPGKAIPIRYNDYRVFKSPLEDFRKAVIAAGLGDRVRCLSHGETYRFEVPERRLSPGSHR
jgi:L-ascorbate metabolism protein UlaG (beta-lactamase superfamily)